MNKNTPVEHETAEQSSPAVMEKVIYTVGGIVAGAIGGYGFGKSKSNSDDE